MCFKNSIIPVSWINLAKLGCTYWPKRFPWSLHLAWSSTSEKLAMNPSLDGCRELPQGLQQCPPSTQDCSLLSSASAGPHFSLPCTHSIMCTVFLASFHHTFLGFDWDGKEHQAKQPGRAELSRSVNYNLLLLLNGTEIFLVSAVLVGIVSYN